MQDLLIEKHMTNFRTQLDRRQGSKDTGVESRERQSLPSHEAMEGFVIGLFSCIPRRLT